MDRSIDWLIDWLNGWQLKVLELFELNIQNTEEHYIYTVVVTYSPV